MRKMTVVLAFVASLSAVTVADARGGRTTSADCDAGSDDPDCPDAPATPSKPAKATAPTPQPPPPQPPPPARK